MAIQVDFIWKGLLLPAAYLKIPEVRYFKLVQEPDPYTGILMPINPYQLNFNVEIRTKRGEWLIDSIGCLMDLDMTIQKSWIEQAYNFLKALPEYAGAKDA